MFVDLTSSGDENGSIWYWKIMPVVLQVHPYLLENREMKKNIPENLSKNVSPLSRGVSNFSSGPRIPVTPQIPKTGLRAFDSGVYNSAYFEHTFLARQMGIEIVEARI